MVLLAAVPSSLDLSGILTSVLEVRPRANRRASIHSFAAVSRLMRATDVGSAIARAPIRSVPPSLSTPRAPGSSAGSLTHSKAFSFPAALLCAGPNMTSMVILDITLRSVTMGYKAWSSFIWPGPASREATH